MNATPTPVTSRGEQAKNTLITAAIAQFGEYGLHATTRDIAALAGQNIAAITYYFGSKEELYMASAQWIADFITHNFQPHVKRAKAILSQENPDKPQIRELIHTACEHMIILLTADETLNLSKFISREQLSPTPAYQLIHQQVIAPMHTHLTTLVGRYTGRSPDDTATILHTHALLGQVLAFRLGRETILLRAGWTTFDQESVKQISDVVRSHIDFILQGLSSQRGNASNEK
ncbi:transcriptional regulator CecR [Buttiauxella agrestis]|uniref:TetR family transcriptional regulator n=1 Tax=Buttiauxella agrestis ATCC 33320 TaxID=1006004 RepID=A0A085GGG2_9ENTR|nr:transcriptional regulator CecR [Buttiauxella agrestis]KFC82807.1 TetR family transcriptional regulator [Buttiauxella agrestis ATCC 33320]